MNLKINDRIRVRNIKYFNEFSLTLRYDSLSSTFGFNFLFNSDDHDQEELACVSHYHEAIVEHNGERLIRGYILSEEFTSSSVKEMVKFGGYSLPGVLEDCCIPLSAYPLQSDGLSLRQIAKKYITPFGLGMIVDPSVSSAMDLVYEKTTADATQSVKDYLTELAMQRDIVISHDPNGNVVFTKAKTNLQPILHSELVTSLNQNGNTLPATNMTMSFGGQQLHSHINVVQQADKDGGNSAEYTIINPYVPIVYRPVTIVQSSGTENDIQKCGQQALASELKNIVLTITTDRWEIDGKVIKPNNIITVTNPDLYLYKKSKWFIESISFVGDNTKTVATLTCVLPEVYNGQYPKNIFVDPHHNAATF